MRWLQSGLSFGVAAALHAEDGSSAADVKIPVSRNCQARVCEPDKKHFHQQPDYVDTDGTYHKKNWDDDVIENFMGKVVIVDEQCGDEDGKLLDKWWVYDPEGGPMVSFPSHCLEVQRGWVDPYAAKTCGIVGEEYNKEVAKFQNTIKDLQASMQKCIDEGNTKDASKLKKQIAHYEKKIINQKQSSGKEDADLKQSIGKDHPSFHKEDKLCPQEFEKVFGMTKAEFKKLPRWKQQKKKKDVGLF